MALDCLTYFYPKNDWKGEYGFDWFRSGVPPKEIIDSKGTPAALNFDNIRALASLNPSAVHLKGRFSKDGGAFYKQNIEYKADNTNILSSEREIAKFYIQHSISLNKWLVVQKDDEYYFYFPVPFIDRRKKVNFDFSPYQSKNKYHYHIDYDALGRVELLSIERHTDDEHRETHVFKTISEVLDNAMVGKLEIDANLIHRLFDNVDLLMGDSSLGDARINSAEVDCSSSEISISYFDGHSVTYEFQAAALSRLDFEDAYHAKSMFRGSSEYIVKMAKENHLNVIEALLTCPFYCQVDQVYRLDEGIREVEIEMHNAHSLKCLLQVEPENIELCFADVDKNEITPRSFKYLNVVEGKASLPDHIENGEVVFVDSCFNPVEQHFNERLVPLWNDFISETLLLKEYKDDIVFYPTPMLSLVDYSYTDKRNGLTNYKAELLVQTIGEFEEVYFELCDMDEKKRTPLGLTKNATDTITLFSRHAPQGIHLLKARDKNGAEVGRMGICVFHPIHLAICFINVDFVQGEADSTMNGLVKSSVMHPPTSVGWTYKDDQYLEILGQAGVVFDDIAETIITLKVEDWIWDPTMKTNMIDTSNLDLPSWLDKQFITRHPEFVGHYRVYVVDQFMVEQSHQTERIILTNLLSKNRPVFSPLVVFKKSIEAANAKSCNPVANGLLRSLGIDMVADFDKLNGYQLHFLKGTTTNVLDQTDFRYTLTLNQWLAIREKAQQLHGQLTQAQSQMKKSFVK